jgi:hypothetical protein
MIFNIFSPNKIAKRLAFLIQNKAKLRKILITTFIFEKNANLYPENCRKSQKIVIITSTPVIAKIRFLHLFYSNTHNYNANYVTENSIVMFQVLKTVRPGWIRTHYLLFRWRRR